MSRPLLSKKAARLIEQIQADARSQVLVDLSANDSITVLHGFDADTKRVRVDGVRIEITDSKGNETIFYRHHIEPDVWRGKDYMAGHWQPYRWYGHRTLTEVNGTEWRTELAPMVCSDFGDLVEVAA